MPDPRTIVSFPPFIIHCYSRVGSTSDLLKEWMDAPEFTCIVADEQTAGRGRRDRRWHSSPGEGLYLSILLRPRSSSPNVALLSLMAAVAVAETMIREGVKGVDIKWPNDVLIRDRKVCGILAEGVSAGADAMRVLLGIGVNLNHSSFPADLDETATSLWIETGKRVAVEAFRDRLLERIVHWYEVWRREQFATIAGRWQKLSSYAQGRKVVVALDQEQVAGITDGVTAAGALRLMTQGGELKTLFAGEIARLRSQE